MTHSWIESPAPAVNDAITAHRLDHLTLLGVSNADTWLSVMLVLRDISIDDFVDSLPNDLRQAVHVPSIYDAEDRALVAPRQVISVFAQQVALQVLVQHENPHGVASATLGTIVPEDALDLSAQASRPPIVTVPENSVVMAVIDDGIAIGNNLFCASPVDSRVENALIMHSEPSVSGDTTCAANSRGRNLSRAQIEGYLAECTTAGLLDEERFYRLTGQVDFANRSFSPVALARSHGTHVTALAGGYKRSAAPDNRPLLCVTLPPNVTEDVSGGSLLPDLTYALKHISNHARRFRFDGAPPNSKARPPVVCNFSYGSFGGSHDGTSPIEHAFEAFVSDVPAQTRRMILPAGNSFDADIHAQLLFSGAADEALHTLLDVPPDDRTANHVQFWLPVGTAKAPANALTFTVTTPFGLASLPFQPRRGRTVKLRDARGTIVAQMSYHFVRQPTQRGVVTLTIYPTATLNGDVPVAPAGRWSVEVASQLGSELKIEAWIDRDEALPGYFSNRRQMRFAACEEAEECPTTSNRTISGFACGPSPIVVGALDFQADEMSEYSSAGPINTTPNSPDVPRPGPDIVSIGDDSPVLPGVLSSGSACGSFVRLGGTSVSCPRIARFVASGLEQGAPGDREWIKQQGALRNPDLDREAYPLDRAGAGPILVNADLGINL